MSRSFLRRALLRRMTLLGGLLFFHAALAAPGGEQRQARDAALDRLFASIARTDTPGAAVGVYHQGAVVYAKGFGAADLEHPAPITPQTPFHVASVSKQFTAFAIALLEREGKLNLDTDLRTYLPYVPNFGKPITVRHLLHHTSGLRDQMELAITRGETMESPVKQAHVLNLVTRQRELNFAPGSEYSYGNTGYTLLGEIVAAVSGQTLRQFTTARIFQPLGMTHTFFQDDTGEIVPGRAHPYSKSRRTPLNFETVGATNLVTTLEDMMKWVENHFHPKVGDAALIRHISASGKLDSGAEVDYGFGLEQATVVGHRAIFHMGYDAGFRAVTAFFPEEQLAVVILRNDGGDPYYSFAAVANVMLNGARHGAPSIAPAISPDREVLARSAGNYLCPFSKLMTLEAQTNRLMWRTAGQQPIPVEFRADGTFDLGANDRVWTFYRFHASGVLERVSTEGGGVATPCKRVDPVRPSMSELTELTGDYRSDELDVTYTFTVEQSRLVARSIWMTKTLAFTPSATDRFDSDGWEMASIVFERDSTGRATGLRANVGNSRNLLFRRVR